jgi:putative transposase
VYKESADYANKRLEHVRRIEELKAANKNIIYIDEAGFALSTERQFGRAPIGEQVHGSRSGQRRPRTSLIAARVGDRFISTFLFKGTCDAEFFNAWLKKGLLPHTEAGDAIVMDNAAFHKSPATKKLIEGANCNLVYLPPYSPDLNPIEQDFANIKKRWQYDSDKKIAQIVKAYQKI